MIESGALELIAISEIVVILLVIGLLIYFRRKGWL